MKYGQISFRDVRREWRIYVVVGAAEILGGLLGVAYGFHHFLFMNFWIGGVVALVPGMILGMVWHFSRTAERKESTASIWLLGLIGAGLLVMAVGFMIPRLRTEMQNLATISQFDQASIRRIEVFDGDGKTEVLRITDPSIIADFARSISDAIGHSPNHPQYSHSWYVRASGSALHEFELHLDPEFPDSVIGYFVVKSGNSTSSYGSFKSRGLRRWVEAHLS